MAAGLGWLRFPRAISSPATRHPCSAREGAWSRASRSPCAQTSSLTWLRPARAKGQRVMEAVVAPTPEADREKVVIKAGWIAHGHQPTWICLQRQRLDNLSNSPSRRGPCSPPSRAIVGREGRAALLPRDCQNLRLLPESGYSSPPMASSPRSRSPARYQTPWLAPRGHELGLASCSIRGKIYLRGPIDAGLPRRPAQVPPVEVVQLSPSANTGLFARALILLPDHQPGVLLPS